jgi:DNA-binding response OmpR family regulator
MAGEKILVVDDEAEISELISLYLVKDGFQVSTAENGQQAIEIAHKEKPDLIILDVLLPDIDGLEVCQVLRKYYNVPILFLSCKIKDIDKILGLTVGGDDYITKPFSPGELIARVKAHLRRHRLLQTDKKNEKSLLSFPGLIIDMESHMVLVDDYPVTLSAKEFQILALLAENPNRVFSPEQLFKNIWNTDTLGDSRTIMVHISNIRKKIEITPLTHKYIKTIKGVGYKFILD